MKFIIDKDMKTIEIIQNEKVIWSSEVMHPIDFISFTRKLLIADDKEILNFIRREEAKKYETMAL